MGFPISKSVVLLSCLFMIFFAINLFDFFSINLPLFLVNYLNKFNFKKYEDFFSGVLMTIFSTPCTAPFVGTAIIYAFSGGYVDIFLIFLLMSIGLSFPLMILLFFSNILKILPKTGEWVLTFKKIMGVSFLISGIWLLSIYSGKLDNNNQTDVIKWKTWHLEKNPDLIKELVAQKKIIFLDITADWCITCKYNKIFILNNKNITQFIKSNQVVTLQMDWTKKNKYIENFIFSKNRFGIPYNEIYSKNIQMELF